MKVGIDISQAIYGTGVSDYVINLVQHLPAGILVPFGYSLRRQDDLERILFQGVSFPIPPTVMHYVWNKLHLVNVETLVGPIDIYHSSDWTQGPSRAKKVTTVHDLSPFLYPQELDPKIVAAQTARIKWVVKECDQIICVSNNTAHDMMRLFSVSQGRIKVIYEALPQRFQLKPQITKSSNYILTIGARQPRKNIARLINVCQRLNQKLIIIGEKPNSPSQIPNFISFTGYVSDQQLVDLLAGASVFVYPSLYEGFGLPILEAFYHGVPVACSNTSSLPEVAGDAAVYFDPLSETAIAQAITEAIANRAKLVAAGKTQLAKFSWDKAAKETLTVYNSLL